MKNQKPLTPEELNAIALIERDRKAYAKWQSKAKEALKEPSVDVQMLNQLKLINAKQNDIRSNVRFFTWIIIIEIIIGILWVITR